MPNPAFVQGNSAFSSPGVSTLGCAYSSNVTAGNLLIVALGWVASTETSYTVSDSQGNTWTKVLFASSQLGTSSAIPFQSGIAFAIAGSTAADTVTIHTGSGGSQSGFRVCVHEVSNADTLDKSSSSTGTAAPYPAAP